MMQDLLQELKSKLSGNFGQVILALMMTPIEYDTYELRNAVKVSKIACLENGHNIALLSFSGIHTAHKSPCRGKI